MEGLCRVYWPPLYAYLRRRGYAHEDVQDVLQGFFAYFLEHSFIDRVDPARGRFRNYLRGILDRFLANASRKDHAAKRGGGAFMLSLSAEIAEGKAAFEPADPETPDAAYSRSWRTAVLNEAIDSLRREFADRGGGDRFAAVCDHLSAAGDRPTYEELAGRLGCSVSEVANLLHRARRRLADLIRTVIRETVESEADVDDEMRELFQNP
jgi:RNA polymerase sigma-70 factor (ECF subfamily)